MYVTDVPVVDRLAADHLSRAVADALDALSACSAELDIQVWNLEAAKTAPQTLSDARDAVLAASQDVAEALARLGIEAL